MNPVLKSAGNLGKAIQQNRRRRRIREYEYEDDEEGGLPGWAIWGGIFCFFFLLILYSIIRNR